MADVPVATRREVLMEAGYRCSVPRCRNVLAMDLHHIIHVSEGGGDEPDNLIAVCGFCHDLYHRGEITREAIRHWKGILVALNRAFDQETIDDLLFPRSLPGGELYLSGDGVLKFSRLIAAGLARFSTSYKSSMPALQVLYWVSLTPKGEMLVDAWLKGDRAALENALAHSQFG